MLDGKGIGSGGGGVCVTEAAAPAAADDDDDNDAASGLCESAAVRAVALGLEEESGERWT